jgi:hypothetical protein
VRQNRPLRRIAREQMAEEVGVDLQVLLVANLATRPL